MPKAQVLKLVLIGIIIYVPILILQYLLTLKFTPGFIRLHIKVQIVPAPGTSQSIISLYEEYNSYLTLMMFTKVVTLFTPLLYVIFFIICLLYLCCRCKVSQERYISILSFANPHAIMVSVYHQSEYKPNLYEMCFKNKSLAFVMMTLYILLFAALSLLGIALQCREMYLYQHQMSNFYDHHDQLVRQIQYDISQNSTNNNCKINPDDNKTPKYIQSPYCEVLAEDLLANLEDDKKWYDGFILQNDYTTKDVILVVIKFSYGIYSGLSTIINILIVTICGSCVTGFYILENGQYIPYTFYAKRKQIVPI
ncbi:hypothetical protein ABPG74_001001 [Tetrahymena malaccensis]